MCWEQNAPPGQVMALVRQNLGPNRSLPEGYHDRWDACAKRWVALFVAKNFVEAMLLLANAVTIVGP